MTGATLDKPTATVEVGASVQLAATVAPADATNQAGTWLAKDTAIATVDDTGKVTGVAVGTTDVVFTTTDGGFTAKSTITVTTPQAG